MSSPNHGLGFPQAQHQAQQSHVHKAPASHYQEQEFLRMAMAASIADAREAGMSVPSMELTVPPGDPVIAQRDHLQMFSSPFSPPSFTSNSNIGTPPGGAAGPHLLRNNSSFSDPIVFSCHVEPLNALLEDCTRLKDLSKDATSFREGCTKLGAVGDEIKLAANNAAQKVAAEDASLYLSKIFASCHKEVSLAITLIEVYGRYSKVKKYAKVFRKWHIKEKLSNAEARLATWLNAIWDFVKENSTVEFQHRYTELVQMDSTASGTPFPDHRSNPDFAASHHSTPREGSAISGLAPLPHNLADLPPLDHLLSSRASEPARLPLHDSPQAGVSVDKNFDRMFTSTGSRRGFPELLRTSVSRSKAPPRRQCRKLQVAHLMAKSVTSVLYVDPVTHEPIKNGDEDPPSGTVWWWSGGYMHVHDVQGNTTSSRLPPADKISSKSPVRRLALDCNRQFVWAGHENGEVSIWREATSKLVCVTSTELSKDIATVHCMEPLADLVVAVGCEGGRVLLLKMHDQPTEKDISVNSQMNPQGLPTHDDKKLIIKVGSLLALVSKASGAIGGMDVEDTPAACAPPQPPKSGPLALLAPGNVMRGLGFLGMRSKPSRPPSTATGDRDPMQPPTPSSVGDSYTGELAEPGTPFQPAMGRGSSAHPQSPALPMPPNREASAAPAAATPFLSHPAASVNASGHLSEASMVATATPRGSGENGGGGAPISQPSGAVSYQSEDLGVGSGRPGRRRPKFMDEESNLLRKVTKFVGQDLKLLLGAGGGVDMDTGGRAHDNRVECMTAVMPYIFTASAANQACDAQIRMWVQSHDKDSQQYGLHDTYHCGANRSARCMCVLPWISDGTHPSSDMAASSNGSGPSSKPWRILTGHDSGNILMFDPSLPHLKPILTIKFPPFVNIPPVDISVFTALQLLAVTRVDGTVQLMSVLTPTSRIMANAIDPTRPKEVMDGVVSLEKGGEVLRLHDRRIDHVSTSSMCCDMATGTIRGNVSLWPRRLFYEKASEAGIMEKAQSSEPAARHDYGEPIFRVSNQRDAIRSSTVLEDQDLDIVHTKDVKLQRYLGNGAFGTVREGTLHHTTVAVKILKESEVQGALGSLAQVGETERQDIRRGLVREVKILKGIRHPNVLFFRGICLHPPMIITELCEHGSVSDVIQLAVRISQPNSTLLISQEKKQLITDHMQWAGRVKIVLDAAKGMLYLHNKDLLHCDLKSLNLLIDKTWTCKVADFGLSRNVSGKQQGKNVPAANNPMWQAPEVISNPQLASKPGDVYSFGIIMWELLMMQRPWAGTPLTLIQHLVQSGTRPHVPSNVHELPSDRPNEPPPSVDDYIKLMERCWDEQVDARPQFEQIVEELESIERIAAAHRTKSKLAQKKWQESVRGAFATMQKEPSHRMRSSRLSSMNYSSTSHRGSLPHVTSNTSSGNLSPLSIGRTPRQAMDLDAPGQHAVEPLGPGSASSPHTTPPSNSGEHSMSRSTTQRHEESGQEDTNDADHMTPRERFQRNRQMFSSKEAIPPLSLQPDGENTAPNGTEHAALQHVRRRSTDDSGAQDNMLSFDDYLPHDALRRLENDGLGTMEGSDQMELRPGLKNPRHSNGSSEEGSMSRPLDVNPSRLDSSSDQPVSQVHITIGNSIQERFHPEDTVSSAAFRSGHPLDSISGHQLDSIPEGNDTQSMDTIDARLAARGGGDTQNADTLDMLLVRSKYGTIVPTSSEGPDKGAVLQPPRPPLPNGIEDPDGQVVDGMYRVSMDHSAIDSLPVLDSNLAGGKAGYAHPVNGHGYSTVPAPRSNASGRNIFNPALSPGLRSLSNSGNERQNGAMAAEHDYEHPKADVHGDSPAERLLSRLVSSGSAFDVSLLPGAGASQQGSSSEAATGAATASGEAPNVQHRDSHGQDGHGAAVSGLHPGRWGAEAAEWRESQSAGSYISDPASVALATPFLAPPSQPAPPGTTSSTGVSTDVSPTLPPLNSAFTSANMDAVHTSHTPREGASGGGGGAAPVARRDWSPFDVEPPALAGAMGGAPPGPGGQAQSIHHAWSGAQSPRDASGAAKSVGRLKVPPLPSRIPTPGGARQPSPRSNTYVPSPRNNTYVPSPRGTYVPEDPPQGGYTGDLATSDFPTLDMAQSPSFRVTDTSALPTTAQQASPFDIEPSAPTVKLQSGGVHANVAADCETAPFFRPSKQLSSQPGSVADVGDMPAQPSSPRYLPETDAHEAPPPAPSLRGSVGSQRASLGHQDSYTGTPAAPPRPRHSTDASVSSTAGSHRSYSRHREGSVPRSPRQRPPSQSPTRASHQRPSRSPARRARSQHSHHLGSPSSSPTRAGLPVASERLPVAGRTQLVSSFDKDPDISPQVGHYSSPFQNATSQPQARQFKERGEKGERGYKRQGNSSRGRTASSATAAAAASATATSTRSPEFAGDPRTQVLSGAFDGGPPSANVRSLSTGRHRGTAGTAGTSYGSPDAVAPTFQGAFDAEPPSASGNMSGAGSTWGRPGAVPDAIAQPLASMFDAEPAVASGKGSGTGAWASGSIGAGAVAPVLASFFDQEPAAAASSGRALPVTDAKTPQLPSLFDEEPEAARGGGGGFQYNQPLPNSTSMPSTVSIQQSQPSNQFMHSSSTSSTTRTMRVDHRSSSQARTHNGSASERPFDKQRSSNGFAAPVVPESHARQQLHMQQQPYAAGYLSATPPRATGDVPPRMSAFDVDPPSLQSQQQQPQQQSQYHRVPSGRPPTHSNAHAHSSTHSYGHAHSGSPSWGQPYVYSNSPSGPAEVVGGERIPSAETPMTPAHIAHANGRTWSRSPSAASGTRPSTGPTHVWGGPGDSGGTQPPSAHSRDGQDGAVYTRSHHRSPFFSGHSMSPEEMVALAREQGTDPGQDNGSSTSTPSFYDPAAPTPRGSVPVAASGRQLSPVAVTTLQVTPHIRLRTVESSASSTSPTPPGAPKLPPNATTRPSRRLSAQQGSARIPPNATTRPSRTLSQNSQGQSGTPLYGARYSLHSPSHILHSRSTSGSPQYPANQALRSLQNVPESGYLGAQALAIGPRSEGSWHPGGEGLLTGETPMWRTAPETPGAPSMGTSTLYSPTQGTEDKTWFESWRGSANGEHGES